MDLSFPQPPRNSVNGGTPTEFYFGEKAKLRLPSPRDLCHLIRKHGKGCYLYSADIARAFRQLPLDPADWSLTCIQDGRNFFIDVSIPFGMRWASYCCQRVTNLILHHLNKQRNALLCYIDDFCGVAVGHQQAQADFHRLRSLLRELGIQEAEHKACLPSQCIVWLGLEFNTIDMTVSIPPPKLQEIRDMLYGWKQKTTATISELRSLLGKLLHVAQCSNPARLFLNRLLATLRACPTQGHINLSPEFQKDITWFVKFLPSTNGVFIMQDDDRMPCIIAVDSCTTACGAIHGLQAYHTLFPLEVQRQRHSICHLEALNIVIALKIWAPALRGQLVHILSDSATAVAVMEAGRGRDAFLQACAREVWLQAANHDIDLVVKHVAGESLLPTADALSRFHLGGIFRDRVHDLIDKHSVTMISVPTHLFSLSPEL